MSVIQYCLDESGRKWLLDNFEYANVEERKIEFNIEDKKKPKKEYIDKDILKQFRFTHPYMFERKLDIETIRKFDIGYDKEKDCITFPVKDINGNILFIATRNIKNKFFHYPTDVDKPLYGYYEILREIRKGNDIKEIYICESMLDALFIWRCGKYAIALNGTGSTYQYDLLKKSDFRVLILATDNDDAGKKARDRLKKSIKNKIIKEIDYASYGDCKDINDMTEEQFLNVNII
jgi:DNA primase